MWTENIPIDYTDQPELPKYPDSPPESCFTTPWLQSNRGLFRVYVAIIRPESNEAKRDLSLGSSKTDDIIKAIPDIVEFLEHKPRRYDPLRG
uniref:Uncharacterized protein n=1 Tax=viral metagenome TaxID=1070528 RepID=A0A6H2A3X2_9ZZZZ